LEGPLRFSNRAATKLLDPAGLPPEPMLPQLKRAAELGFAAHPALRIGDCAYAMSARSLPDERAVLAVLRDRTEELRRELAEADFISNAAHELRNPLAGISSAIEVLQEGAKDDPEARDHFLSRLAEDAERMSRWAPGRPRSSTSRSRSATRLPRSSRRRGSSWRSRSSPSWPPRPTRPCCARC